MLLLLCAIFWFSGASRALAGSIVTHFPDLAIAWPFIRAAYVALAVLGFEILLFPLAVQTEYPYSAHPSFGRWLGSHFFTIFIEMILIAGGFTALYFLIRIFPHWWLPATLGYAVIAIGIGEWGPALLLPRLHKPKAVNNPRLLEHIQQLGISAGRRIDALYEWDAEAPEEAPHARLIGMPQHIGLLFQTEVLRRLPENALLFLAARTLAWAKHPLAVRLQFSRVILAGLVFFCAEQTTAFVAIRAGLEGGSASLGAFPILAASLFGYAACFGLIINAFSRHMEIRADRFALQHCGGAETLQAYFEALFQIAPFPVKLPVWQTLLQNAPTPAQRLAAARRKP